MPIFNSYVTLPKGILLSLMGIIWMIMASQLFVINALAQRNNHLWIVKWGNLSLGTAVLTGHG